jgi:hypothetical protein
LLNASQLGFRARHSMTLQCMRLADHVTLHFNNNISTAVVFLVIEKVFETTWRSGLLYKLSKSQFSNSLIKLIGSFLSQRKLRVSVEGMYAKVHAGRGSTRFRPIPHIVQFVYKWYP